MRTFFMFVIVFSLLVSCHQHHQERSEDQANQPVLSAVEKDSTDPAIQAFSQAVLAFQDGSSANQRTRSWLDWSIWKI